MKNDYIELTTELLQLISSEEAFHYGIIPKSFDEVSITFYIDNRKDLLYSTITNDLNLLHNKKINLEPLEWKIINKSLAVHYRKRSSKDEHKDDFSSDFFDNILDEAINSRASDIHIEVYKEDMRIRYRIDGVLIEKMKIPIDNYSEIVNQIKIRSKLNITEKRLPQDGRIQMDDYDIRVSFLPTQHGEKVVLRLLRREKSELYLENLGFDDEDIKLYYRNINKPNGIILISGPTGSGKTTTLYATLQYLNKASRNIVTVEDPIEYTISGINQVQINEEIGLTFSRALKSFLRQDPDIIMLGEIRDYETAQMAIRAALTGHLVLSTIHTNSSLGTISRLIDMDVPSYLIADTLNISIAQRLIRVLCDKCKIEHEKELLDCLPNDFIERFEISKQPHYRANGCDDCYYTGYSGRKAIYELLPVDHDVLAYIKKSDSSNSIVSKIKTLGFQALKIVEQGQTSLDEVYPILLNQR